MNQGDIPHATITLAADCSDIDTHNISCSWQWRDGRSEDESSDFDPEGKSTPSSISVSVECCVARDRHVRASSAVRKVGLGYNCHGLHYVAEQHVEIQQTC